jgi:outer membrane protein OmpA-like peptidoglycan-associated protein
MKSKLLAILIFMSFLAGCTTNPYSGEEQMAKSVKYGGIATATGAAIGALVGGEKGAYIGAGVGALIGGGYGYYTDTQEAELRKEIADSQMTLTRNADKSLTVSMPDVTFQTNSATIQSHNYQALTAISNTVKERNGAARIIGHTDNLGSIELNQNLSQARANSVANYMFSQGIPFGSVQTQGMAFYAPVADNSSESGRARNRRVEIILQ